MIQPSLSHVGGLFGPPVDHYIEAVYALEHSRGVRAAQVSLPHQPSRLQKNMKKTNYCRLLRTCNLIILYKPSLSDRYLKWELGASRKVMIRTDERPLLSSLT